MLHQSNQIRLFILGYFLILLVSCNKETDPMPDPAPEVCEASEAEQKVIDQLDSLYAYRFESVDPEIPDPALDPLIEYLGDADIVGLGEGTHGTSEFFTMKDKIFRRLATEKGFDAIVFEIPWGNAMIVNDYVTEGTWGLEHAINQTFYWVYDTREVRDLAQWIHDRNFSIPDGQPILFVGCDPQGGDFSEEKNRISGFISQVEPDSLAWVMSHFDELPTGDLNDYIGADADLHQRNAANTQWVYSYLEANRDVFIAASSFLDFEIALMAAHVIGARADMYWTADFGWKRDSLMAFYSEWWQRILGPDSKIAIWAHNAHVMDAADFNADWMGTFLRANNPEGYKNLGFSFGKGSFNAFVSTFNGNAQWGVREQFIPNIPCETVNFVLSEVSGAQHYLLFEELENEARTYFNTEQDVVQLGAGFNINFIDNYTRSYRLARLFDVWVHIDETQASDLR